MDVMHKEWKRRYPGSKLSEKNLLCRLWQYQKKGSTECKMDSGGNPVQIEEGTKPSAKDLAAALLFPKMVRRKSRKTPGYLSMQICHKTKECCIP